METKQELKKNFALLIKDKNFIFLMISFALSFAIYGAIASTVGDLANSFGFSSDAVSIFGAIFVISGLVGSVIHAIIMDKYQKFK